jgi:hypothetical protein
MTATTDGYCYIKMVLAARAPDRMHRCGYCIFLHFASKFAYICIGMQRPITQIGTGIEIGTVLSKWRYRSTRFL